MPNWSQGGQGAMGGAATGAVLGSVVPGIGTGVGAVAGGLIGGFGGLFGGSSGRTLPGYDQRNAQLQAGIQGAQGRAGVNIGQYERSAGGTDFRSGQQQLIGQLQAQAAGRGPSLASLEAQRAAEMGMQQQMSMAASAAPGNEAIAARQAMQNNAGITQGNAMTAAQARMAEQMAARQQLGGLLGQARGMDMNNEQFNAGQQNGRMLSQAQMNMQNLGRNDAYDLSMRGLELGNAQAQMGGQTPNTFGTQMMSGGANLLAMYGSGAFNGKPGVPGQPAQPAQPNYVGNTMRPFHVEGMGY